MSKTRYLWAAALLALCVGLTAGSALAVGWTVTAENIPDAMIWDQELGVVIDTENTGDTNWNLDYSIMSVETPSGPPVNRWGVTDVPIAGSVPYTRPAPRLRGLYTWAFDIIAPPIASIAYPAPVGPTTPAAPAPLACLWQLAEDGAPFYTLTPAGNDVAVGRFPDLLNPANAWCAAQVQQLAGLHPNKIVGGYPSGNYEPLVEVTRDQMAVFIVRATGLPTDTFQGAFPDVPVSQWAWPQIEAMATAGLVGGYGDGLYHPEIVVRRDQMAMFVARGMLLSTTIPSGPPTPTFPDMPTSDIAYNSVEFCVDNNVVGGYPDGYYRPAVNVNRAQMAVFIYRSFIQPTPCVIVLAGPGTTNVDAYAYDGFSTITQNPANAYVGFDVLRMGDAGPVVKFEVKLGATLVDSITTDLGDVTAAKAAAAASGNPYLYAWYTIPALDDGDYTLVTTVDDVELARTVDFSVGTFTPSPPATATIYPTDDVGATGDATLDSGTYADLAADDNAYQAFSSPGSGGGEWELTLPSGWTPASVLTMEVTMIAKVDDVDAAPGMGCMTSGTAGGTRPLNDLDFATAGNDTETTMFYETANKAKFVDIQYDYGTVLLPAGTMHLIACVCPPDPALPWIISFDLASVKFTYR